VKRGSLQRKHVHCKFWSFGTVVLIGLDILGPPWKRGVARIPKIADPNSEVLIPIDICFAIFILVKIAVSTQYD
jgi:hypothetical protein